GRLHKKQVLWAAMLKVWCRTYLPGCTGIFFGPSWSLTDRLSQPQIWCGGTHRATTSPGAGTWAWAAAGAGARPGGGGGAGGGGATPPPAIAMLAQASPYSAQPAFSPRSRPRTRLSTVRLAFFVLGLSKLTSKSCSSSNFIDELATTTPVMVTTTAS